MSRASRFPCSRALRAIASIASCVLAAATVSVAVAAQDPPPCDDDRAFDCVLPAWSDTSEGELPSLFGPIDGLVWVSDERDDAPPDGLDILAVGIGSVDIDDPAAIRESSELLKLGARKKAVRSGRSLLVRIVLDRPLAEIPDGHSSVHMATNIDGSRSNVAPTAVRKVDNPFAGSQDIYSLTYAATTGKTKPLTSDLAKAWYEGKSPFAAAWAAPNVLDMLIAPQKIGAGIRAISFVSGEGGGYDAVSAGEAPIPLDGKLGLVPNCIEGAISIEPFTVGRLVEGGQTLRNVEAPASWRGGASFHISARVRDALETVAVDVAGDSAAGEIKLPASVSLFEDGDVIRQSPEIMLAIGEDTARLSLELGLTRRGYSVIRNIELKPTGDEVADMWMGRAADALVRSMPPFRVAKKTGPVAGVGDVECIAGAVPLTVVDDA